MGGPWETFVQLLQDLAALAGQLALLALRWSLLIAWVAWWLWAVNWRKAWAVLAEGAWVPAVLLVILVAMVWSQLAPSDYEGLGFMRVSNFWWQLVAVGFWTGVALFCGWLQGVFAWEPVEVPVEPPAHAEVAHGAAHH